MKNIEHILVLFILIILSCNNENDNRFKTKKYILGNGKYSIAPYTIVEGDTLINGIVKYYSKKGVLEDEIEFKNSKENGWHIHYEGGRVNFKVMLVDNVANGHGFFYDNDGNLESDNLYSDGNVILNKVYYKNGQVKIINFFFKKTPFYGIKYDSLGKKIFEKGVVFYDLKCNQNLDSVKLKSRIEIMIPVVSLPEYSTNIQVAKFNESNEVIDVSESLPIKKYIAIYKTEFSKAGLHKLGIAGELKDSFGKVIRRDTAYQRIMVIN